MPEAPAGPGDRVLHLLEQLEDLRQLLRGDPDARVLDADDQLAGPGRAASRMRPGASVYLAALPRRLIRICSSRVGSTSTAIGAVVDGEAQLQALLGRLRPDHLDGTLDDRAGRR